MYHLYLVQDAHRERLEELGIVEKREVEPIRLFRRRPAKRRPINGMRLRAAALAVVRLIAR